MKIVKVRSPFFIEVNEIGQIGSLIELSIWNKGSAEPTIGQTGFYSLSKPIASLTQIKNSYNVSNFVKDFIDNIKPNLVTTPTIEDNNEWVNFRIKRYWNNDGVYTLLDNNVYVGINGFTDYVKSVNDIVVASQPTPAYALINPSIVQYRYDELVNYVNVIAQRENTDFTLTAYYYNSDNNALLNSSTILSNGAGDEVFNFKVPLTYGATKNQTLFIAYAETISTIYSKTIEECKYTPVVCSYINRYGGWQFLTFFKAQTNSINVSSSNFKLAPENIAYNIYKGQSQTFNINGTQTIKLNTGFVEENYSELIIDLMLSQTILLDDKPVKIKTQSSELKNSLKDKLINYEIEFEYNYDLINNVI
jgi:hypothetical protein